MEFPDTGSGWVVWRGALLGVSAEDFNDVQVLIGSRGEGVSGNLCGLDFDFEVASGGCSTAVLPRACGSPRRVATYWTDLLCFG